MKQYFLKLTLILVITLNNLILFAQVNQEWVAFYNGPYSHEEIVKNLLIDKFGNIYMVGSDLENVDDYSDFITIKLAPDGTVLWTKIYDCPTTPYMPDNVFGACLDSSQNIIITGDSWGDNSTHFDITTIKYSTSGEQLWVRSYSDYGHGQGNCVISDRYNNIYVTGTAGISYDYYDYITIKYDSSGNLLWEKRLNGEFNRSDQATKIKVGSDDCLYATGCSNAANNYEDILTVKYDSA